ncbi:MAG: type II toxin-antitoxin system RatA family toxin [Candidatus Vesicomyosocius endoextente]|uniref:Type II toxin-antitoxin system RatA family toxin n=1 Tax=Candidatus Vesicomyosocius endoextente TaxID=2738853 RepID=A0A853GCT3_9GAMM|nr:type II toxin-antitoxin system RatA family toxin [Candidatus Vesicomyosocius endoextente]
MHHISKNAIVSYSCKQMYQLINQVNQYPEFLNWCSYSSILKQSDNQIIASIKINKGVFNQTFTTTNTLIPYQRIDMKLKEGLFKQLNGSWVFVALNSTSCKVELNLAFSFSSKLVDISISHIFTSIANSQLDAFIIRAKTIYG